MWKCPNAAILKTKTKNEKIWQYVNKAYNHLFYSKLLDEPFHDGKGFFRKAPDFSYKKVMK